MPKKGAIKPPILEIIDPKLIPILRTSVEYNSLIKTNWAAKEH